jgi:hypothetical protein
MTRHRRLRAPALVIAALAAFLVFSAGAAAETRTGETTTTVAAIPPGSPEARIVKSSAAYESTGGSVSFNITTAAEPKVENKEGKLSETKVGALLFTTSECNFAAISSGAFSPPLLLIESEYKEPTSARAGLISSLSEPPPSEFQPAAKTVSGTTTTLAFASGQLVDKGFNCAAAEVIEGGGGSLMVFPISVPPAPPVLPAPPAPAPAPAPAPGPPGLSIAKAKPLKLKVGKSKTVKVKVTNTGATATAQGSLRMKPTKGVLVTPETQKLPALAPGASWTVSVRVQLTEKAKKKSTLSLTGTASGVSAKGSLVVKLKG